MEELKEYQNEMSDAEIKEAIKLFNIAIKCGKINYKHADPIKQYCYTSSSDIYGVFFPNSEIIFNDNPDKDFLGLAKDQKNNLLIVYTFKNSFINSLDSEKMRAWASAWHSEKLFYFVYDSNEVNFVEKMQREINAINDEVTVLKSIKLIYNKDGSEKADILKAFDPQPAPDIRITAAREYSSVRVGYSKLCKAVNGVYYNDYKNTYLFKCNTYADIKNYLSEVIPNRETEIKRLRREIAQIKQISKRVNNFIASMQDYSATARNIIKESFLRSL